MPSVSRRKVVLAVVVAVAALTLTAVLPLFACSQTPTSVPVRTFERAQRMDVACLQLYNPDGNNLKPDGTPVLKEPSGIAQEQCAPIPGLVDGSQFQKQLFAFVTQTTRGELAVVNLSAGALVDQSRATPGVNFLPVGALPTDVATTPDGKMAFVASAEANKPAIYGIPTRRLLGDTDARFPHDPAPVTIASWPVCALPQNPGALAVIPRRGAPAPAGIDAGAGDAGASDAGDAGAANDLPDYELVVVLPGDRLNPAKIVTIDPRPFRRGGLRRLPPDGDPAFPNGKPDFNSDLAPNEKATLGPGPILEPGSLAPCPITSAIELAGSSVLPAAFAPGAKWDDGVKYVTSRGTDLTCLRPQLAAHCGTRPCCTEDNSNVVDGGDAAAPRPTDGGVDGGNIDLDAGACATVDAAGAADSGTLPLDLGPLDPPRLVSIARDNQLLYVADEGLPLIHVVDLSTPNAPRELAPLLATSQLDPSRVVQVKEIAISPPTREYKRFVYAIDRSDGSIMVYDVTDPATMQRTPLSRPHPELNPFQPPDRIAFSAPVVSVAFARHDLPLARIGDQQLTNTAAGILCNPNHNLDGNPAGDLGFYYRASASEPGDPIGPRRLRGIFGFATLGNGQVLPIDVDDWDAPCRRPADMSFAHSDIAPAQPFASAGDTDPYHEPNPQDGGAAGAAQSSAINLAVTNEAFFPMTSPHTLRSEVLINNDVTAGSQIPRLQGAPIVGLNGVILPQLGLGSENTPLLDVAFATEDPHAHIDQDWTVTYEGVLPGFDGLSATITTDDTFQTLTLRQPDARFCSKGVEDWTLGVERTTEIARSLAKRNIPLAARSEKLMSDYVQLTEELLPPEDPWWTFQTECWSPEQDTPAKRQDICARTFGNAADQSTQRDFPIVEAYDDHLVLGRYYITPDNRREVVSKDSSNVAALKMAKCCFHNQARFHVRTGALWSTVGATVGGGAGVGFLSHVTTGDGGRCVTSCDPREALLNGRLFTSPPGVGVTLPAQRNSPLATRNPMFAMWMRGGDSGLPPARDTAYTFSTRGQFRTLFVSVAGGSTAVSPQSTRYIEALGQLAVVDGASQGLVLIDLRAVTVARAPYF